MSFFNDSRSHYTLGFLYGVTLRFASQAHAEKKIVELDKWAYEREWTQNMLGVNPNVPMSAHQMEEARAWGLGARKARGVYPPFPVPPYLLHG